MENIRTEGNIVSSSDALRQLRLAAISRASGRRRSDPSKRPSSLRASGAQAEPEAGQVPQPVDPDAGDGTDPHHIRALQLAGGGQVALPALAGGGLDLVVL